MVIFLSRRSTWERSSAKSAWVAKRLSSSRLGSWRSARAARGAPAGIPRGTFPVWRLILHGFSRTWRLILHGPSQTWHLILHGSSRTWRWILPGILQSRGRFCAGALQPGFGIRQDLRGQLGFAANLGLVKRLADRDRGRFAQRVAQGDEALGGKRDIEHGDHRSEIRKVTGVAILNVGPDPRNCGNYVVSDRGENGAPPRPSGRWAGKSQVLKSLLRNLLNWPLFRDGSASIKEPFE